MKHKLSKILGIGLTLALLTSLLVTAAPVAASHDSTATVAFTEGESDMQGQLSTLDVEVTNSLGSLGNIDKVVIDFSGTAFTEPDKGTEPAGWTGVEDPVDVITYTHATGIAPGDSETFVPAVTNPLGLGLATNPVVTTSDAGSNAKLEASEDTGWIGYAADAIGSAGNNITVEYLDADAYSLLVVSVGESAISVELADDGTDSTSTASDVAGAINGDAATGALVTATVEGEHGEDLVPVMSATALSGGSLVMVDKPCPVTGDLVITELLLTVDVTANPATSASPADYDISFTTIGEIAVGETISITFPAEYDIAQVVEADVNVTGYITAEVVTVVGQAVTIADDGTNPLAAAPGLVEVIITNTHVKNPPVSGDYYITVAISTGEHGDGEVTITPASFGVVAGIGNEVTAGVAFAVTVTALNAAEPEAGTDIGYIGAHYINFSSTATGAPTIPAFELITFDVGVGVSAPYFVLPVAEADKTITADATEPTIAGVSLAITINPATFVGFLIEGEPTTIKAGVAFTTTANDIIVTAQDADGNTVTGYTGTVTWDSSDDDALLPGSYTFTTGDTEKDNGVHTFLGNLFTLKTVGEEDQTITVTDAAAIVSKESTPITVTPAAAASIVVTATPSVIEADGSDISTITATALDEFGNVDTNYTGDKSITIASSLGTIADANPSFTLGEAPTTLTSDDKVGTATISIRVTSDFDLATTTVKLLADIGITTITVTVDKITILNDGFDECTITATYKDSEGDVVTDAVGADYAFTFSVVDPDTVLFDPVDPMAGVATVTLTTIADPETAITITANGIGAAAGEAVITVGVDSGTINLVAGWNLISLPLIPTDSDIDKVLAPILSNVDIVWGYDPVNSLDDPWASFKPGIVEDDLTEMNDGEGFWVLMSTADVLVVSGYELCEPPPAAVPPQYAVVAGWNLIGYKFTEAGNIDKYLGPVISPDIQAIYSHEAATGYFIPAFLGPGCGYWIALTKAGTIYPNFAIVPLADLTDLAENLDPGDFVPAYVAGVYEYALDATNLQESVTLTSTLADATILYTYGAEVDKEVSSGVGEAIALEVGANVITIKVELADHVTTTYTITVTRAEL